MVLVLLLFFEIFLFFYAFILSDRDILAPSVMMCTMFIISTVFALINIKNWDVKYNINTCLIISGGILVFILAENATKLLIGKTHYIQGKDNIQGKQFLSNDNGKMIIPQYYFVGLLLLNVVCIVWYYFEIKRIVTALNLLSDQVFAAYREYYCSLDTVYKSADVDMINTFLSQLLKVTKGAGYICSYYFIVQLITDDGKRTTLIRKNWLVILNIIFSMVPGLMLAGRNDMLQLFAAILVYYYIVWHQYNGWEKNISWRYIKWGGLIVLVGVPAFYGMLFLLGRKTDVGIFDYASIYIGGSIALFNDYLMHPVGEPKVFGEETLEGVHLLLDRLGIPTYVRNRHLEFRNLTYHTTSNTYTCFRRPLHDYGMVGMYVFMAFVAVFFAWFYYGKIKGFQPHEKKHCSIIIYGYLFYWIVYSSIDQRSVAMISTTTLLTFLIIYFEWYVVRRIRFKI